MSDPSTSREACVRYCFLLNCLVPSCREWDLETWVLLWVRPCLTTVRWEDTWVHKAWCRVPTRDGALPPSSRVTLHKDTVPHRALEATKDGVPASSSSSGVPQAMGLPEVSSTGALVSVGFESYLIYCSFRIVHFVSCLDRYDVNLIVT